MTDEQKIIDGVDVSGCEHLYREIDCLAHIDFSECCEGYNHSYGYCPNIPNCYYKQLKRLELKLKVTEADYEASEQECKKLKKELTSFMNGEYCSNGCSLRQQLNQLKEEKEELKVLFKDLSYENQKLGYKIEEQTKQLEPFKDEHFKGLETIVIAELAKKSIRLTTENRKLENALDEIEEYINTHLDELAVNKIKDIINGAKDIKVPHKAKE